jgi:16S rRNA (guanine527-N7)-methyltransferase
MNQNVDHISLLTKYYPELTDLQLNKLKILFEVISFWNDKINVISRKDMGDFFLHHVIHSLALVKLDQINPSSKVIDIGTGGGFPGIPLAIYFSESEFILTDSIGKKIKVVNEIIQSTGILNVTTNHIRAEQISQKFDIVTGRAVTQYSDFIKNYKHLLKKKGIIHYWTGYSSDLPLKKPGFKVNLLNQFFEEEYFSEKVIISAKI